MLDRLHRAAKAGGRMGRVIEVLALQALAQQAQGQPEPALANLAEAIHLAQPEGYFRLFLDEGAPMIELLTTAGQQAPASQQTYIADLLNAYRQGQEKAARSSLQPLIEPLSDRELEIVGLIAGGMSNSEIAEKLVVTVGTVKWHLNNIYGKLDVRSRTQAVARVRELGLL